MVWSIEIEFSMKLDCSFLKILNSPSKKTIILYTQEYSILGFVALVVLIKLFTKYLLYFFWPLVVSNFIIRVGVGIGWLRDKENMAFGLKDIFSLKEETVCTQLAVENNWYKKMKLFSKKVKATFQTGTLEYYLECWFSNYFLENSMGM